MKFYTLAITTAIALASLGFSGTAFAATSQITITAKNGISTTTIAPSGLNYAGTVLPFPGNIGANTSQTYTNTGIGTVTSFHLDYTAASGGKKCHFDASSYITTAGLPYCTFNKAAQSKGTTFATCTATITQMAPVNASDPNCSFSVTFNMQ
ncbi:MAG: hypothetical protein K0S28_2195 [Paucimonas sp.]|jgi:hypothetical protein|nr:hypothetical protein [Paucimonas sp.]